jgi:tRNA modification GTPase
MPFSTADTIVAIATPPGRGAIGIVRLSGPDAQRIAAALTSETALEPRRATLRTVGRLVAVAAGSSPIPQVPNSPSPIDQVVATLFPAPHSYTGDDVVELSAHGSPAVLQSIVRAAISAGARLAEPGEFTLRAFLSGRLDLMQAEAVADLVDAVTPLQARAAFDQLQGTLTRAIAEIDLALFQLIARLEASVDFPEEGYHFVEPGTLAAAIDRLLEQTAGLIDSARRGRLIRDGLTAVIVGRPNVGKSSLFNALAGAPRAIVTDVPGTTRDLVTEVVDVDGVRVTLVDTAGLREARDIVEAEGVSRSKQAQRAADVVVIVLDQSEPLIAADFEILESVGVGQTFRSAMLVANKSDKTIAWTLDAVSRFGGQAVQASAATGAGLDDVRRSLARAMDVDLAQDSPALTNARHEAIVRRAHEALTRARAASLTDASTSSGQAVAALPEEFVLADLQEARAALEEISGRRVTDDLLAEIFSKFCIGK